LSGGANQNALAIGAKLTDGALIVAGSAMFGIEFSIDTDICTVGQSGRADAFTICTYLTASAFCTTGSAIMGIDFGVDTKTCTGDLSIWAVEYTLAI
jgi:hypothetical protein